MRTKTCDGVLRVDLVETEPRVGIYLVYDGLAGISKRPILRDLLGEFARQGPDTAARFLAAIRKARSGYVDTYFNDYVSYGVGGGDAAAEYHFRRFLLLHEPARPATSVGPRVPEHLALQRPEGWERLSLEGVPRPPREDLTPADSPPNVEPQQKE